MLFLAGLESTMTFKIKKNIFFDIILRRIFFYDIILRIQVKPVLQFLFISYSSNFLISTHKDLSVSCKLSILSISGKYYKSESVNNI